MSTQEGSCHCGAVQFEWDGPTDEAMSCNCSICRRKGYLLAFAPMDALRVSTPTEALATYTFNKHAIQHQFCTTCGCAPFGVGKTPDGQEMAAVNLRCVPGVDLDNLKINKVDGASF